MKQDMARDVKQGHIHLIKMHSVENIILVVPPGQDWAVSAEKIRKISDFRTGIGADQVMVCSDTGPMHIWNQDGSQAVACGNGTRCVIGWMNPAVDERCTIQGPLGPLTGWKTSHNSVAVAQGRVQCGGFWREDQWIESGQSHLMCPNGIPISGMPVDVGNQHVVVMGHPPAALDALWKPISLDFPDGVNVSFVWPDADGLNVGDDRSFHVQTWERAVGFSRGCGSAACAVGGFLWHQSCQNLADAEKQTSSIAPSQSYQLRFPGGCIQVWQETFWSDSESNAVEACQAPCESLRWVHSAEYQAIAHCFWMDVVEGIQA